MLTMAGNRGPMMVNLPGMNQANVVPPKLTEEEKRRRNAMLAEVRGFDKKEDLKRAHTDDKSYPMAEGKIATPVGWKEGKSGPVLVLGPGAGRGPGRRGPGGPGRGGPGRGGPAALGDLFAGGFRPNPGALRGGGGRGRGK